MSVCAAREAARITMGGTTSGMTLVTGYLAVVITLAGLVVGSFLNVVIYRLPRGESLVRPGSHCPACGHAVRWYDNIPVLSFVRLRGHCHDCGARISLRYPLVEVLTGSLFLGAFLVYGAQWRTLEITAFFAALVAVTFIDFDLRIIPDKIVLPGAAIGIVASVLLAPDRWWQYVVAGLGAAGFLFALGMLWPGGMGFGDVKLALFMGVVLGADVIIALFVGFLAGGLIGGALLLTGVKKRTDKIPFGPYLSLGAVVAALSGAAILDWYLRLF
jgi:leader peptidase (prepilin peptidase)/N-methyltransferase